MAQTLWLFWWPKNTATTTKNGGDQARGATASSTTSAASTTCLARETSCCCLSKLVRKLKRCSRSLHAPCRQSSFQCRYDPLSYALNFDTTGSGSLLDEDYQKFCSFSSRFVATSRASCPRLVAST
ncbi:hypothetical protein CJ030_MR1G017574 [Morella rubra]|uniref:Uncharacterized protein n=1 Tax=Morella rubra TaxID=262757 RepID=A0A6A1WZ02_9ROSI|nr:hypothetical protein CJ030_MR1G017574 [Morella rubra]